MLAVKQVTLGLVWIWAFIAVTQLVARTKPQGVATSAARKVVHIKEALGAMHFFNG